jgi:hypothetical protein
MTDYLRTMIGVVKLKPTIMQPATVAMVHEARLLFNDDSQGQDATYR